MRREIQHKGIAKAFVQPPRKQRKYIKDAIRKSVIEDVALAKSIAPSGSCPSDPELGRFKEGILGKFEVEAHALVGSIEAAPATQDVQVKRMSIEFGCQYKNGNKRQPKSHELIDTGCADPVPVLRGTQSIIWPNTRDV